MNAYRQTLIRTRRGIQFFIRFAFAIVLTVFIVWDVSTPLNGKDQRQINLPRTVTIDEYSQGVTGPLVPEASFYGTKSYERVAYALSTAGDVNGDGYADFLIGTFHNSQRGQDAGAAYLILGHPRANWGRHYSLAEANARFFGRHAFDAVGGCVAGPGDVNGDGLDDIFIGAPAGNELVANNPGHVFILWGKRAADWGQDCILERQADVNLAGELTAGGGGLAGFSIAILGDMNQDGCDELLVSAPYLDRYGNNAGKVYLIPGRRGGWPQTSEIATLAVATFACHQGREANLGFSLAVVGDLNNDGIDDFAMSAPGVSKVFIFYGKKAMNWGFDVDVEQADVIITGAKTHEKAGYQVDGAGDLNGDDQPDLIISAIENDEGSHDAGKTYVVFGKAGRWSESIYLGHAEASFLGEASEDYSGWSLSGVGDFDGDGLADFVIGMFNDSDRSKPGKAYLITGRSGGWPQNKPLGEIDTYFLGEEKGDLTGFAVSRAGDVNGDGWDDFLVASPYWSRMRQWGGQVLLFMNDRRKYNISGKVINFYDHSRFPQACVRLVQVGADRFEEICESEFYFKGWEKAPYRIVAKCQAEYQENFVHISAYDAALTARHVVGVAPLKPSSQCAADVDQDDKITLSDASLILQASIGLPRSQQSQVGEWATYPPMFYIESLDSNFENIQFSALILGNVDGQLTPGRLAGAKNLSIQKRLNAEIQLQADTQFELPIRIETADNVLSDNVLSFNITIKYNSQLLEFQKITFTEQLNQFTIFDNLIQPGELKIAGFSGEAGLPVDKILMVHFRRTEAILHASFTVETEIQINAEPPVISILKVNASSEGDLPAGFTLFQNYPNPFNSQTIIKYQIPIAGTVTWNIFNLAGQLVYSQQQPQQSAGQHQLEWDGTDVHGNELPSGIYFYQILSTHFNAIKKGILLR